MLQNLNNLNNIALKFSEATGAVVLVELRMRLIAETYKPLQHGLAMIIKDAKKQKKRIRNEKYWDCDLEYLVNAVIKVFSDVLQPCVREELSAFRKLRNPLVHSKFVQLMENLGL